MVQTLKTIKLQGKDYITVDTRISYFNENYPNGSIKTEVKFIDSTVYFRAVVTPDVTVPDRTFIGHSFGQIEKEKAFEKLETVAVGRGLAFMGIGIVEGIASADEMKRFNKTEIGCEECGMVITEKIKDYSESKYNKALCMDCQKQITN